MRGNLRSAPTILAGIVALLNGNRRRAISIDGCLEKGG